MIKKIISVILAVLFVAAVFCSCGDNKTDDNGTTAAPETTVGNIDLNALYENSTAKMPEMLPLDADMILDFCGIKAEDCEEVYVSICADSLRTDEIWLVKAVSAEALQRIEDLANARLKAKADESITYSPEQYAVVQKAKIIKNGNYFALIVSPDVDEIVNLVNETF